MNLDCFVEIPNIYCGEVGEPFTKEVLQIIKDFAEMGWWPVDFGEDDGVNTQLWFAKNEGMSYTQVRSQVNHFLKTME